MPRAEPVRVAWPLRSPIGYDRFPITGDNHRMIALIRLRLTRFRHAASALALLLIVMGSSGCALYRNDRCFVEDWQYEIAHNLYTESGSLDIVTRLMQTYEWRRCQINEIVYRLRKEFEVVSE